MKQRIFKIGFILIAFIVGLGIVNYKINAFGYDFETNENIYDYVNSDNINGYSYTIHEYTSNITSQCYITARNAGTANTGTIENQNLDNPIVGVIPKEYFFNEGSEFIIGEEYGFYINTVKKEEYIYFSTALVFDIETNTNLISNTDNIYVTIKPLFEFNYYGLLPGVNEFEAINNLRAVTFSDLNLEKSLVLCMPTFNTTNSVIGFTYTPITRYMLEDISVAGQLFNQQDLNFGDDFYNAQNDLGAFFTSIDYEFKAQTYKDYQLYDMKGEDIALSSISLALGFVNSTAGTIFDIYMLIANIYELSLAEQGITGSKLEIDENKLTVTDFYGDKSEQISRYQRLIKEVAIAFNSKRSGGMYYGVDDYFTAKYKLAFGNPTGCLRNSTLFKEEVAFKIYDSYNKETVAAGSGGSSHAVNKNPKQLTIGTESQLYLLPEGLNTFSFHATFASYYEITLPNNNLAVKIDGVDCGTEQKIYHLVCAGQTIEIEIYGNDKWILDSIKIEPTSNLDNIEIYGTQSYIVMLGNLNGLKKIMSSNNNVLISKIYYLNSNKIFTEETLFGEIKENNNTIYQGFESGKNYYLILKNNSRNIETSTISFNGLDTLELNVNNNQVINTNFSYYKFYPNDNGQYILNLLGTNFDIKFFNSNFEIINNIMHNSNGTIVFSCDGNKTYYLGIREKNQVINENLKIQKAENFYSWEISGGQYGDSFKTYESQIKLTRGVTYTLKFWINNKVSIEDIFCDTTVITKYDYKYGFIYENNRCSFELNSPVGGNGIKVYADGETDQQFKSSLALIPEFENEIGTLNVLSRNDIILSGTVPAFVKRLYYKISFDNSSKTGTYFINNISRNSLDFTINISNLLTSIEQQKAENITILIYQVAVDDATVLGREILYNCNDSVTSHNLFHSGTGTSVNPYIISCARHFYNIRYSNNSSTYFKLVNVIQNHSIYSVSLPINFVGVLDGNNNTLFMNNITYQSYTTNMGLFTQNSGIIRNLIITYNQYLEGTSDTSLIRIGAITGYNSGTIENCSVSGDIYDKSLTIGKYFIIGGIAGINYGTINNCSYESSTTRGFGDIGGIAGINYGTIRNSNVNSVHLISFELGDTYSIGGIAGKNYSSIYGSNIINSNLNGRNNIGGIAGINNGTGYSINYCKVLDSKIYGSFESETQKTYLGGITGINKSTIYNSTVESSLLYGVGDKGGIAGYNKNSGTIEASNAKAGTRIYATYYSTDQSYQISVGGIAGINEGPIGYCNNYAAISYTSYTSSNKTTLQPRIGQIVGTNNGGGYQKSYCYGTIDKGYLQTITWKGGFLNLTTYTWNQALYVSSSYVGKSN